MVIDVFMIDPPWPKKKGGLRKARPHQGRTLEYCTMSIADIFKLLDNDILTQASDCHNVFLWLIDQYLHDAELEMLKRNYKRHARFVWDKGNGVAPAFTVRYSHEYLVWFYKPKLAPIALEQRGKFTTVIKANGREHSRKPDEAYSMVETLYPESTKMDVFSRETRLNWQQYGNECNKFN